LEQVGKVELNNNYANLNRIYCSSVSRGGTSKTSFILMRLLDVKRRAHRRCIDVVEMLLESFACCVPLGRQLGYKVNLYDLQDIAIPF
jgi:hypothetical protein